MAAEERKMQRLDESEKDSTLAEPYRRGVFVRCNLLVICVASRPLTGGVLSAIQIWVFLFYF